MVANLKYMVLFSVFVLLLSAISSADDRLIEVRSPHVVVIGDNERHAREMAHAFENLRNLLYQCMEFQNDLETPWTIVDIKDLLREGSVDTKDLLLPGPNRGVLLLDKGRFSMGEGELGSTFFYKLKSRNYSALPVWVDLGMGSIIRNNLFSPKRPPEKPDISPKKMIPLEFLLSGKQDADYLYNSHRSDISDKLRDQSWALIHYLLFADNGVHTEKLKTFTSLIRRGIPESDAAVQAFGDLKLLENGFSNYIKKVSFYKQRATRSDKFDINQYPSRQLSVVESLAIKGEELASLNRKKAKIILDEALRLEPQNSRVHEALGFYCLESREREEAWKYFTAAAELDSNSYLGHYYAAESLLGLNSPEDATAAEKHLRKAIEINPRFEPAYVMLSFLLQAQKERLPEALSLMVNASTLQPLSDTCRIHIIGILVKMGRNEEAIKIGRQIFDRYQGEQTVGKLYTDQLRQILTAKDGSDFRIPDALRKPAGPAGKIAGRAVSVQCNPPARMDIMIRDSKGREQHYVTDNYFKVRYLADVNTLLISFIEPCYQLPNDLVKVDYLSVETGEFSGVVTAITIQQEQ
jgi:tetratricopeptide (TPR) repeat protein